MNIKELRMERLSIIEQWKKSNKGIAVFCKENNIHRSSFYYWHSKYKETLTKTKKSKKFIPVNIVPEKIITSLEVLYPNGVKVILTDKVDLQMLRAIINIY